MDNIFILNSEDNFLIDEEVTKIHKSIKTLPEELVSIDLDYSDLTVLNNELRTIPFLEEKRVVVVKNVEKLFSNDFHKDDVDLFKEYLSNPLETSYLILLINFKPDGRNALFKEVKKSKYYKYIEKINIQEIDKLIIKEFKKENKKIDNESVKRLILISNNDLLTLKNEIQKLILYTDGKDKVTLRDINKVCSKSIENNIFLISDYLLSKNKQEAYKLYLDMLNMKQVDTPKIIGSLAAKLKDILMVKTLLNEGYSKDNIKDTLKISPGHAYHLIKDSNRIGEKLLKQYINELAEIDYKGKSGKKDMKLAMELFFLMK